MFRAAGYQVTEFKSLKKGIFKELEGSWTDHGRQYVQKESGLCHRMNDDVKDAIYTVLHFLITDSEKPLVSFNVGDIANPITSGIKPPQK